MSRPIRPWLGAVATALLGMSAVAPGCVGVALAGLGQGIVPAIPVTGVIALLVSLGLVVRSYTLAVREQALGATAAAVSAVAPIAILAQRALDARFDPPPSVVSDIGNVESGIETILGLVLLGILAAFVGRAIELKASALHTAARIATIACALLLAAAAWRGTRWPDPDGANHLTGLPALATLPPVSLDPPLAGEPTRRNHVATLPDLDVTRSCEKRSPRDGYRCMFSITRASETFELRAEETLSVSLPGPDQRPPRARVDAPMIVRRSVPHDLLLIDVDGHPIAAGNAANPAVEVRVRDLATALAPPAGWRISAALTLALAAIALVRAASTARRLERLARGRPATLTLDGWIELDDGQSFRASATEGSSPPGRVVVFSPLAGDATYREAPASMPEMVVGDRDEHLRRFESELRMHAGAALAAAALGGTPLAVAAAVGMLI